MNSTKLLSQQNEWDGKPFTSELFPAESLEGVKNLSPITQIQAVCFTPLNEVVLYHHVKGWVGLPGGHLEPGDNFETALSREIEEEVSCEMVKWGLIGYERVYYNATPDDISFFLRAWADVTLLEETPDPDGKALKRVVIPFSEAADTLGYGEAGSIWLERAKQLRNNKPAI